MNYNNIDDAINAFGKNSVIGRKLQWVKKEKEEADKEAFEEYKKYVTKLYKEEFNKAVTKFYNDYNPTRMYYYRDNCLYNVFITKENYSGVKLDPSKILFRNAKNTGEEDAEDGLYKQTFVFGWHGGAQKVVDYPRWRTPPNKWIKWSKHDVAIMSPSPEELFNEGIKTYKNPKWADETYAYFENKKYKEHKLI